MTKSGWLRAASAVSGLMLPALSWAAVTSYAVIGDAGKVNHWASLSREAIDQAGLTRLILPGDNLYDFWRTYSSVWGPWKALGFTFDVVAIGNHTRGYSAETRYFGMPGEYFSKTIDGVRFLVLNSDNPRNASAQVGWLDGQLQQASEKLIFLVYHHPSFTLSTNHDWREKRAFQLGVRPLLLKYQDKITGVLVGHDHIATVVDVSGLPLVVSGAAGEAKRGVAVSLTDGGAVVRTRWLGAQGIHWARLDVDAERDSASVSFFRVDGPRPGLACSARLSPRPVVLGGECARSEQRGR